MPKKGISTVLALLYVSLMQRKVKVLLLKPLINKGQAGDIVEVKTHYALNVLLPQEIAVVYDKQTKNQHEAHQKRINAYKQELKSKATTMVEQLKKDGITFEKQATDQDMLYDSISDRILAQHLMQAFHINLTIQNIKLEHTIEKLGEYTATLQYEDIVDTFPVHVVRKK
ncbi:MAG: 50S ribosomal protein L9 [bacterium]|nr:50S ribosomal protein L9 [bacterium]